MKNRTMICRTCGEVLRVSSEITHTEVSGLKHKPKQISTSDDGVYFEEGKAWFCNECWDKVNELRR